ncbi:hypothetical protein ACFLTN_07010 [Chloroflexota bacterium]
MSYRDLFRIKQMPVFQNKMFSIEAKAMACSTGDVILIQSMETGLVYNAACVRGLPVYEADYQNEQSYSGVFKQHLHILIAVISQYFYGKTRTEVRFGKSYLHQYFQQLGYWITRIDPTYDGTGSHVVKSRLTGKET